MDTDILEQINKSALRFLRPLTPEYTYPTIIEEALKLVDGDEGYIAMADDTKELQIVYSYLPSLPMLKMRQRGFSYTAYVQRKAFVTYPEDYKDVHPEFLDAGIQSTIFIPLSHKGESIGVINIISKQRSRRFSHKELTVLKLFGSLASMAIRKTQLYSEVKSALEARDLFLSMAAHEFRTPITTIGGYAQMLKLRMNRDIAEKRWVEEIYRETQRLTRLVNELLEVNRIRSGQFQYNWRECNLYLLITKAAEMFQISHPEYHIDFNTEVEEEDSIIIGDNDKLLQVLTNVLDNAAKFSSSDKPININSKRMKDEIVIRVIDYGKGILKKDQEKIFKGFYRGANNAAEGMSLGLHISRQIINEHKGTIRIKSKIDKGTTVEISFPKTPIAKAA